MEETEEELKGEMSDELQVLDLDTNRFHPVVLRAASTAPVRVDQEKEKERETEKEDEKETVTGRREIDFFLIFVLYYFFIFCDVIFFFFLMLSFFWFVL